MVRQYSSTAVETTLSGAITGSSTSIIVGSTSGFPLTFPYTLSIDNDNASKELVEVTAAAGTTLTVTRAIDGTSAVSHSLGAAVRHDHSARDFRESRVHEAATAGVHGVTGDVVGDDDVQVLTNKDLSSPTNTFPSSLATDAEVASAVAAEAALARNADNLSSGTVADARVASTIARDSEVTAAIAAAIAAALPPGTFISGGWSAAPSGYLLCDGTSYATAAYPDLFAAIGYGYGGAGANFNVPNLKGRVPVGKDAAQTEFDTLGETGGAKTHTLSTAEMPAHNHGVTDPGHTHAHNQPHAIANLNGAGSAYPQYGYSAPTTNFYSVGSLTISAASTGISIQNTGGGGAHNNLQPYTVVNYAIKA